MSLGTPEGARVGAIRSEEGDTVNFFGYGVYVGREPCPHLDGRTNPKILLDDGSIVWGCESWWGPEEQIRKRIAGKTIVVVHPNAYTDNLEEGK